MPLDATDLVGGSVPHFIGVFRNVPDNVLQSERDVLPVQDPSYRF